MRIFFLSNIPTPYQVDFWKSIQHSAVVSAVFLSDNEPNRDWNLCLPEWASIVSPRSANASHLLRRHLAEFRPDVIVVGGYRLPLVWQALFFAWRNQARFFYWLEKPLPSTRIKAFFRRLIWQITLPLADGVLCIGRSAQRAYSPYARSTLNLPYSIDISRYSSRDICPAALPVKFLFVGQYIERKGLVPLLEVFSSLDPAVASLSLAGSGAFAPLVADYSCTYSHICDYGFVQPHALPALLASHDVFILPSRHDGWGVVILEAMASGLPVISTLDTGAFEDLLLGSGVGRLCEPNPASIAAAVAYYLERPSAIQREGSLAYDLICASDSNVLNSSESLLNFLSSCC